MLVASRSSSRFMAVAIATTLALLVPHITSASTAEESLANCQKVMNFELQSLSALSEKIHTAALGLAVDEFTKGIAAASRAATPGPSFSQNALKAAVQIQKLEPQSPAYIGKTFETNVRNACDPSANSQLTHTKQQFFDRLTSGLQALCERLKADPLDVEDKIGAYVRCAQKYAERSSKRRLKVKYPHLPEILALLEADFETNPPSGFSKPNLDRAKLVFLDTEHEIDKNANNVPDPDDATDDDPFAHYVRLVFVTGPLFTGDLGGLAGADAFCQRRAADYSLPGTYKAWLSDGTTSAATRISHRAGIFALIDGTKVADSWSDLTNGNLDAPINLGAGGVVHEGPVWTGSAPDGSIKPALCPNGCHCQGWHAGTAAGGTGLRGRSDAADVHWARNALATCDTPAGLYCIQQ